MLPRQTIHSVQVHPTGSQIWGSGDRYILLCRSRATTFSPPNNVAASSHFSSQRAQAGCPSAGNARSGDVSSSFRSGVRHPPVCGRTVLGASRTKGREQAAPPRSARGRMRTPSPGAPRPEARPRPPGPGPTWPLGAGCTTLLSPTDSPPQPLGAALRYGGQSARSERRRGGASDSPRVGARAIIGELGSRPCQQTPPLRPG